MSDKLMCLECGKANEVCKCDEDYQDLRPHMDWIQDEDLQQIITTLYSYESNEKARKLSKTLENYYGGLADMSMQVSGKQMVIDDLSMQVTQLKKFLQDNDSITTMLESVEHWYNDLVKGYELLSKSQRHEYWAKEMEKTIKDMKEYKEQLVDQMLLTEDDIHPPRPTN